MILAIFLYYNPKPCIPYFKGYWAFWLGKAHGVLASVEGEELREAAHLPWLQLTGAFGRVGKRYGQGFTV